MILKEILNEDLKLSMVEKKKEETKEIGKSKYAAITVLKSKLMLEEKSGEMDPKTEYSIVNKELNQINDSLKNAKDCNREDIINQCNIQVELLNKYINVLKEHLPKEVSIERIIHEIELILDELDIDIPTKRHMGDIMKLLMPRLKNIGTVDGKLVNKTLQSMLY